MNILENFLNAIEFPKLLEGLAVDCQTPAGKAHLKAFQPIVELAEVENRLAKTQELEKHLLKGTNLLIPDAQHFHGAFQNAKSKGEILSAEELASLVRFLLDVIKLRQFLSLEAGVPPVFQAWLERLQALPALREFLQSQVTDRGEIVDSASPE